ncbi:MAG: helix-turn-helix domain-containing protein [Candidatus Dadabacteria bacterium]|nr:helix-turn-helix domain-containing protein [Candidatus Dadabacteria bacterium]
MDQTRFLQRVRMNQFERVYRRWKEKKVTQAEAAEQFGIGKRTFRRYTVRYSNEGMRGLLDRRLGALSHNRAPQEESSEVMELYKTLYNYLLKICIYLYRPPTFLPCPLSRMYIYNCYT